MKLHLPSKLKAALMACIGCVASLGTTLATGALAGGVFLAFTAGAANTVHDAGNYTDADFAGNDCFVVDASNETIVIDIDRDQSAAALAGSATKGQGGTITKQGAGMLTVTDKYSQAGNYTLHILEGTLKITNQTQGTAINCGDVYVTAEDANATLLLGGADMLGWGAKGVQTLTLKGSENYTATLRNTERTTMDATLNLKGHTLVTTEPTSQTPGDYGYDLLDSMSAEGTDNIIEAEIYERGTSTITVAANGSLTMSGGIHQRSGDYDGAGGITKAGAGDLLISAASTITRGAGLTIQEGTVTLDHDSGTTTVSGLNITATPVEGKYALEIAEGSGLAVNGTMTASASILNNGAITLGDSAKVDISGLTPQDGTYSLYSGSGTMSGLTASKVTGFDNVTNWLNVSDSAGTVQLQAVQSLTFAGESLTWEAGATGFEEGKTFAQKDSVAFTNGAATVTLGENVETATLTIASGADVAFSPAGHTVTAQAFTLDGTLRLTETGGMGFLSTPDLVAGSGAKVVVDLQGSAPMSMGTGILGGYTGAVVVEQGVLTKDGDRAFSSLTIQDGGQLRMAGGAYSGAVTLSGSGLADVAMPAGGFAALSDQERNNIGALKLYGTMEGKVTIADRGATINVWGTSNLSNSDAAVISGDLAGEGTLTKTGYGTLVLQGTSKTHSGDLHIVHGKVQFGNGLDSTVGISFNNVIVEQGAHFRLNHKSGNYSHVNVTLNGGTLYSFDNENPGGTGAGISFGKLTVNKDAVLDYEWKSRMNFEVLTGKGNLYIYTDSGTNSSYTQFKTIHNYSGKITAEMDNAYADLSRLGIGATHQDADYDATIELTGANEDKIIEAYDFAKTGEGSLTITAGKVLFTGGTLTMNYEGDLALNGTLSVADNMTLVYNTLADDGRHTINLGTQANSNTFRFDVLSALASATDTSATQRVNLGITVAEDADLTAYTVLGQGTGWYSLERNSETGTLYLVTNENWKSAFRWDLSWGGEVLASFPSGATLQTAAPETALYLGAGDGAYNLTDAEGAPRGVALSSESSTKVNVFGGITQTADVTSISGSSWIEVQSGTYGIIAGGNHATWGDNSGHRTDFVGDSHIQMKGGTADIIIGGNYQDGHGSKFTGNSYISIYDGATVGSIVGGYTAAHNASGAFDGSSHIFIYTPMAAGQTSLDGSNIASAIIGGNWQATNVTTNAGLSFEGSSEILVDLSKRTDAATFGKVLIGADMLKSDNISRSTFKGSTHIHVNSSDTITYSGRIIGGSFLSAWNLAEENGHRHLVQSTISGGTNVLLDGGKYTADVIGGSYVEGRNGASRTSTIGGPISVTMQGSTQLNGSLVGGFFINGRVGNADSRYNAGSVTLDLLGGSVAASAYVAGGSLVGTETTGNAMGQMSLGDITVNVDGATVSGLLYGGSSNWRVSGAGTDFIKHGNITINLLNGSVAKVYAAGNQGGSVAMSALSTTVNVGAKMAFAEGAVVSGGYNTTADNTEVVNGRTLAFTGEGFAADAAEKTYTNIGNVSFKDFDEVRVAQGVTAELGAGQQLSALNADALTVSGAGTLKLAAAQTISGLNIDGATVCLAATEGDNVVSSVSGHGSLQAVGSLALGTQESGVVTLTGTKGAALNVSAAGTITSNGTTTLSAVGDGSTINLTGAVIALGTQESDVVTLTATGGAALNVSAAGTITSNGTTTLSAVGDGSSISLTGAVKVASGTLVLGAGYADTADSGAVALTGGSLELQDGVNMKRDLTLSADSEVEVASGTATFSGSLTGADNGKFSLTKTGAGTLLLGGNDSANHGTLDSRGDLIINAGSVAIAGNDDGAKNVDTQLKFGNIYVNKDTTLILRHKTADFSGDGTPANPGTNLLLSDATIESQDIGDNDSHSLSFASMQLTGSNDLVYDWKGTINLDELKGSGSLDIGTKRTGEATALTIGTLRDFGGTIGNATTNTPTANFILTVGSVEQAKDFAGTIARNVASTSFSKSGEGSIAITGTLSTQDLSLSAGKLLLGGLSLTEAETRTISLTGGTLASAAELAIAQDVTLGAVTLGGETGYTAAITLGGADKTLTFEDTVTNKGALTLTGKLYVAEDKLANLDSVSVYSEDKNGFLQSRYTLVGGTGTVALDEGAKVYIGADDATGITAGYAGGAVTFDIAAGTAYYVNEGTVSYTDGQKVATAESIVLNGGTLAVAEGKTVTQAMTFAAASTISGGADSKLSGAISLAEATTVGDLTIDSTATKAGTTSSYGDGFRLDSEINLGSNKLIVNSGVVLLGNGANNKATNAFTASTIQVNKDATLQLGHNVGDHLKTGITLNGGTLHVQGADGSSPTDATKALNMKVLDILAGSAVTSHWDSRLSFTELKGSGDLSLSNTSSYLTLDIAKVDNYTGALTVGQRSTVNITGDVTLSKALSLTGGTMNVAGTLTLAATESTVSGGKLNATGGVVLNTGATLKSNADQSGDFTLKGGSIRLVACSLSAGSSIALDNKADGSTSSSTITGDNTTLNANITGTGNLTLDGANGTLNLNGSASNAGNLTIQKATMGLSGNVSNTGKLTIDNATMKVGTWGGAAYKVSNTGDIDINGSTVTLANTQGKDSSITEIANGGDVNINGGKLHLENYTAIRKNEAGTNAVNVRGGQLVAEYSGITVERDVHVQKADAEAEGGYKDVAVISGKGDQSAVYTNLSISNTLMNRRDGAATSSLSKASLTLEGDYQVTNVSFTDSEINVKAGTLTLNTAALGNTALNVAAGAKVAVAGDSAVTLTSGAVTVAVTDNGGLAATEGKTETLAGITYTMVNTAQLSGMTLGEGASITLNLTGEKLEGILGKAGQGVALQFDNFAKSLQLTNLVGGGPVDGFVLSSTMSDVEIVKVDPSANGGTVIYIASTLQVTPEGAVPEPTTATLSLLALAALAARRRRQKQG